MSTRPPPALPTVEELVSFKWSLSILRALLEGPARFSRLRAAIPGVSANVLSARLGMLQEAGVVERVRLPEPADRQVYRLTDRGHAARGVVDAVEQWSRIWEGASSGDPMTSSSA